MALSSSLDELRSRLNAHSSHGPLAPTRPALALSWGGFDALLPDGGFPHGVVEISAPYALGGGTLVALAAIQAAQRKDPQTWCAWINPHETLYAPGVVMAGVELHRLLVVRPLQSEVWRIAVKVARSLSFAVIVIDGDVVGSGLSGEDHRDHDLRDGARPQRERSREVIVRKLALLATEGGATVLLLTDARRPRAAALPVALRLELERAPSAIHVKIGKDRYGRGGLVKAVPLHDRPCLHLAG